MANKSPRVEAAVDAPCPSEAHAALDIVGQCDPHHGEPVAGVDAAMHNLAEHVELKGIGERRCP